MGWWGFSFIVGSSGMWTTAVILPLLLLWTLFRTSKFRFFTTWGIPGPAPSWLNGNYDELMLSGKGSWLVVTDWIRKYGSVFGYYQGGPSPVMIMANQEILKTILIKDFSHFSDRKLPSFKKGLVFLTGDDWKRVRTTLAPTFTAKKMKTMSPKMNSVVDILLSILEEKCLANAIVDIYGLFQGFTLDVIGNCAFGMEVDCQRNPDEAFLEIPKGFIRIANNRFTRVLQMFPELMFVVGPLMKLFSPNFRRLKVLTDRLQKTIDDRRARMQAGNTGTAIQSDMMQLMVEASQNKDEDTSEDGEDGVHVAAQKKYLTDEEMVSNAFLFLIAGFETTANCLGFTAYLLAKYPEIQQRLHEELVELYGTTVKVDYELALQASYLDMVLSESLRLFPPVTNFVTRVASETVKINGQVVPKGTVIEVPVWYLHHDAAFWDQPDEFNPDRFSEQNKPTINSMSYMPFGTGPRNCVGMRFALLEIKIALIAILRRYRLDQCEKSEPEIQLQQAIGTINRKNGVFVRLTKR